MALHPGRMMEKPERQPHVHWTTFYDFEETRNIELCSYTGSSILDHDFGYLCRGRRIQMSGHSDLGIFNNF